MAAVVAGVSVASSTNNAAVATGAFTPTAGDLLIAFAIVTGQAGGGTFTDSQSLGWTQIATALKNTSADTLVLAVANSFAAASSMTVTFTPAGSPTSTGVAISVLRVSGMTRNGASAVRQSATQANQAASTPAPAFAVAALTGNSTVGAVANATNPATMTTPASWTERHDIGYSGPTTGLESVSRDSGFTGTTITWGSASASALSDIIAELNTTVPVLDEDEPVLRIWTDEYVVTVWS